jgi:hypothetical protein
VDRPHRLNHPAAEFIYMAMQLPPVFQKMPVAP